MEGNNKPAKSIVLLMGEFRGALVDLVNKSGLPAPITYMIVKEMLTALEEAASQQYDQEKNAYDALVKENANDVRSN